MTIRVREKINGQWDFRERERETSIAGENNGSREREIQLTMQENESAWVAEKTQRSKSPITNKKGNKTRNTQLCQRHIIYEKLPSSERN